MFLTTAEDSAAVRTDGVPAVKSENYDNRK